MLNKNCEYFALFNGIKEQVPVYDGDVLKSVVDLPYSTSKPTTSLITLIEKGSVELEYSVSEKHFDFHVVGFELDAI